MEDGIYQVTTRYFCAAYVVQNNKVILCAPILKKKFNYYQTISTKVANFFTTMSMMRYNHLMEVPEADLNIAERCLGWHFCPDNDGKLITKQDKAFINFKCNCPKYEHVDDNDCCI